jgi:hypothetical protein
LENFETAKLKLKTLVTSYERLVCFWFLFIVFLDRVFVVLMLQPTMIKVPSVVALKRKKPLGRALFG